MQSGGAQERALRQLTDEGTARARPCVFRRPSAPTTASDAQVDMAEAGTVFHQSRERPRGGLATLQARKPTAPGRGPMDGHPAGTGIAASGVLRPRHAVADAAVAEDVLRIPGVVAELAAQLADGVAHGSARWRRSGRSTRSAAATPTLCLSTVADHWRPLAEQAGRQRQAPGDRRPAAGGGRAHRRLRGRPVHRRARADQRRRRGAPAHGRHRGTGGRGPDPRGPARRRPHRRRTAHADAAAARRLLHEPARGAAGARADCCSPRGRATCSTHSGATRSDSPRRTRTARRCTGWPTSTRTPSSAGQ